MNRRSSGLSVQGLVIDSGAITVAMDPECGFIGTAVKTVLLACILVASRCAMVSSCLGGLHRRLG